MFRILDFRFQDVQKHTAELIEEIELSPNGQVVALNVPAGQRHTVKAMEFGSVIWEMKDGVSIDEVRLLG